MLTSRRRFGALAIFLAASFVAIGCSATTVADSQIESPPSTVEAAVAETEEGLLSVTVGVILNQASPTASRDLRLSEVMTEAAEELARREQPVEVQLEIVTIDDVVDVGSAVDSLANQGVSVIAASCDDTSMPAIVDAAIEQEILVVTGCVAIPRPELDVSESLLIDLASLGDSGPAIADWLTTESLDQVVIISSGLIPDVEQTCLDVEGAARATPGLDISARADFIELVDPPADVVAGVAAELATASAIVVCALPPAVGDVTDALRAAGFAQPVIVPWFGEPQTWADDISDVFVFTPSSRHGDDPAERVGQLYAKLDSPEALDAVTADALEAVAEGAAAAQSTGSRRIADAIRNSMPPVFTGEIVIGRVGSRPPVVRQYRVLEVTDGNSEFVGLTELSG